MIDISLNGNCSGAPDCTLFHDKWTTWARGMESRPMALVEVSPAPYYREHILDAKSRNMVKKANRYYFYQTFNYNHHLNDIYEINTSKPHRQGMPMTPAYQEYPEPIKRPYELCLTGHRYVFIGGFNSSGQLKAYCALALVGDIAIINQILGHGDSLPNGIMNGMFNYLMDYLYVRSRVRWLNYLTLEDSGEGLNRFKRSVGFKSEQVSFVY